MGSGNRQAVGHVGAIEGDVGVGQLPAADHEPPGAERDREIQRLVRDRHLELRRAGDLEGVGPDVVGHGRQIAVGGGPEFVAPGLEQRIAGSLRDEPSRGSFESIAAGGEPSSRVDLDGGEIGACRIGGHARHGQRADLLVFDRRIGVDRERPAVRTVGHPRGGDVRAEDGERVAGRVGIEHDRHLRHRPGTDLPQIENDGVGIATGDVDLHPHTAGVGGAGDGASVGVIDRQHLRAGVVDPDGDRLRTRGSTDGADVDVQRPFSDDVGHRPAGGIEVDVSGKRPGVLIGAHVGVSRGGEAEECVEDLSTPLPVGRPGRGVRRAVVVEAVASHRDDRVGLGDRARRRAGCVVVVAGGVDECPRVGHGAGSHAGRGGEIEARKRFTEDALGRPAGRVAHAVIRARVAGHADRRCRLGDRRRHRAGRVVVVARRVGKRPRVGERAGVGARCRREIKAGERLAENACHIPGCGVTDAVVYPGVASHADRGRRLGDRGRHRAGGVFVVAG